MEIQISNLLSHAVKDQHFENVVESKALFLERNQRQQKIIYR